MTDQTTTAPTLADLDDGAFAVAFNRHCSEAAKAVAAAPAGASARIVVTVDLAAGSDGSVRIARRRIASTLPRPADEAATVGELFAPLAEPPVTMPASAKKKRKGKA